MVQQVLELLGDRERTEPSPRVVGRQPVVTTSLDVYGGKVKATSIDLQVGIPDGRNIKSIHKNIKIVKTQK